jgi:hypothetical protein
MHKGLVMALTALVLAGAARADTVYLRDGRELSGKVTKASGKVILEMAYGTVEFPESEVLIVAYGSSSQPAGPPPAQEPGTRAALRVETAARWDINQADIPEPIVFMLSRQMELARGDPAAEGLAGQIKQWRIAVHEGKRKFRDQWLSRDDRRRLIGEFHKHLKNAQENARQARSVFGTAAADLAKKKQLAADGEQSLYRAAGIWPDGLTSDFLTAVLDLRAGKSKPAESRLRRCVEQEPLLAGFHQGRGLALVGSKQALAALAEFVLCLQLRDDSPEPIRLIEETCKEVPGAQVKDPIYLGAQELLGQYDKPRYAYRPYGGMPWLMPGTGWQSRDDTLFVPPYERILCKQALAIPVTEDGVMVVDKSAIAGAELVYVQVAPDLLVRAEVVRSSYAYSSTRKADVPAAFIRASGVTFTPVDLTRPAALKPDQTVTFRAANCYREMGTEIRAGQARVAEVTGGVATLEGGLLPGEGLAAVFDGEAFAGLLTGRTDPEADGCGASGLVPPADLAAWFNQAKSSLRSSTGYRTYGGPTLKSTLPKRAIAGQWFPVFILVGEAPPPQVGK